MKCDEASGKEAVRGLQQCMEVYGRVQRLLTNQGLHFKKNLLERWCDDRGVEHYFLVEYDHRSNGFVERGNKSIVEMLRKEVNEN